MKEFKINEFIKLKFENGKTNIYVNDKLFNQCKYILIRKKTSEIKDLKFTQDANVLIIMHENHQTALLRRIKSANIAGWNADTNIPVLASGVGTAEEAYFVNTAGLSRLRL